MLSSMDGILSIDGKPIMKNLKVNAINKQARIKFEKPSGEQLDFVISKYNWRLEGLSLTCNISGYENNSHKPVNINLKYSLSQKIFTVSGSYGKDQLQITAAKPLELLRELLVSLEK